VLLETMRMLRELGISTAPRAQELLLQDAANDGGTGRQLRSPQVRPMH